MSVTAIALMLLIQAAPAQSIDGRWINPDKSVIIQIAPCGEARCGTVEWASAAAKITVVGPDQIKVAGCALGGLLCDSQLWNRTADAHP